VRCVCVYTADGRRSHTVSPAAPGPLPVPVDAAACFVPIDPARPAQRRRLPDVPTDEPIRGAVVLRQPRSDDARRPPLRPNSGVGSADLGVAATGLLYAAANRSSWHSVELPPGENSL